MMQKHHILPHQIEVVMEKPKRKTRTTFRYCAYLKGTTKLLGWIEHRNSPAPHLEIVNCDVRLKRDVFMMGHSSKLSSDLPLIGGHGSNLYSCADSRRGAENRYSRFGTRGEKGGV